MQPCEIYRTHVHLHHIYFVYQKILHFGRCWDSDYQLASQSRVQSTQLISVQHPAQPRQDQGQPTASLVHDVLPEDHELTMFHRAPRLRNWSEETQ